MSVRLGADGYFPPSKFALAFHCLRMRLVHRLLHSVRFASSCLAMLLVVAMLPLRLFAEPAESPVTDVLIDWQEEIQPLLRKHCVRCHGAAKRSSELSLQSLVDLLGGGDRGPTINHDEPQASLLVEVLDPQAEPHMPPDEQLDGEAIAAVHSWVRNVATLDPEQLSEVANGPDNNGNSPSTDTLAYPPGVEPSLVIDMAVQAGWQDDDMPVQPAALCDDNTFVRRLHLDLVGRIPTPEERETFLGDTDSRKRSRLIDRLLSTSEHARHMAELFDTILMERGGVRAMNKRQQHGWTEFLTGVFAENRPWDQVARQILLARPESPADAGATWYLYERKNEHQQIAEAISRGIFGVQIQCAQCHDHPLADEIKQAHYWGLVGFFNRGKNTDTPLGPRVAESAVGGFSMFTNLEGESQPNRLVYLHAEPVDESRPDNGEEQEDRDDLYEPGADKAPRVPRFSRRRQFVDRVLSEHPLVARAMVNRLWAFMMGRGLVHPVDQLDSQHPPSHPELLDWLSEDFQQSGYDVRRLLAQIARSKTYQLSSKTDAFVDPAQFAVAATKPLSAETLYRSMLVALDSEDPEKQQTPERLAEYRSTFPDVLPEESIANLRQALLLTNGSDIHELLSPERSQTIARLRGLPDSSTMAREAFLCLLGRPADEEELQRSVEFLDARRDHSNHGVDQLVWALLTSAEFQFNH